MKVEKDYLKKRSERHLHSPDHVLADELSVKLNDTKNFAQYLGMAKKYDHGLLRRIAGEVLENKSVKKPGALFSYLVKKNTNNNPSRTK